jgi:hypothetical protein
MGLELHEIKAFHDKAYLANQQTRIKAADDRLFARVSQWDSTLLQDSQLAYKGEFDIITKARREINADLTVNQPQVEFSPTAETDEANADLINGLYLSDDRHNDTLEAYTNAVEETIDCGLGGWELFTTWESNRAGERNQVIRRNPLYEFNNNCFPDPNAKRLDKSDAKYWSILVPYTVDGYKEMYRELKGEESDIDSIVKNKRPSNFANPEVSYVFPWFGQNDTIYVVKFYHKTKVKDKVCKYTDPMGNPASFLESSLYGRGENGDIDLRKELKEQGFEKVSEKKITRWEVTCYIASGEAIIDESRIAGEHIPVVPEYGERAFVEGEEVWEGVVRRAKDPQRLRNFMMSFLGDMVSRSNREKPLFFPEQVAGYEDMYSITGAENNYPYALINRKDPNGNPLPETGPVGYLKAPDMPPALPTLLQLTRESVEDVANPGLPKNFTDTDMSGVALELVMARFDNQSQVYQEHRKHAKRYDAVVYASMASEVYDSPRSVTLTLPDGTQKQDKIMDFVLDKETGEMVAANDLTNAEFEVYATIGPTYNSQKQKSAKQLDSMIEKSSADPELQKILTIKRMAMEDGPQMADIREWANKQLMLMGVKEPETDEELAFMEEAANKPQEPDANMVLAQAEQMKAEADMAKVQNDNKKVEVEIAKLQIQDREITANTQIKAAEAQSSIRKSAVEDELNQAKIRTEDAKIALELEKIKLERERLQFEREKMAAELQIKLHAENNKMRIKRYDAMTDSMVAA